LSAFNLSFAFLDLDAGYALPLNNRQPAQNAVP
jgi:hypothetical protein